MDLLSRFMHSFSWFMYSDLRIRQPRAELTRRQGFKSLTTHHQTSHSHVQEGSNRTVPQVTGCSWARQPGEGWRALEVQKHLRSCSAAGLQPGWGVRGRQSPLAAPSDTSEYLRSLITTSRRQGLPNPGVRGSSPSRHTIQTPRLALGSVRRPGVWLQDQQCAKND